MTPCARCGRPLTAGVPRCVYCGADAPPHVAAVTPESLSEPAPTDRRLVLLRVEGTEPEALARALGVAAADATHRVRRGGWQLLRIGARATAEEQARRLGAAGLVAALVTEAEVRTASRPVVALGGEWKERELSLRTSEGPFRVATADLLLIVQGPITREYQTSQEVKRSRTATLEGGYRYHLHRRGEGRPVELDPGAFDFGAAASSASSLLQLSAWVQELGAGVSVDDGFRRLPPELGVAEAAAGGPLAAADALGVRGGRGEATLVLDNLRQFRFYSAWRGELERGIHSRAREGSPPG
jgi:hypothetical protein